MDKTFMIIDDDLNIRKMLELLINKNNLGRVIAELDSGQHAVDEINFYKPDIVLIDMLLPFLDGIEITKQSKLAGYQGKFIMISQVEDQEMIARAYENGILFFLNKPINRIEAINVIKGVCHNIDLEKSLALIKSAVFNINNEKEVAQESSIEEKMNKIFNDIGIIGVVGNNDIKKVVFKIIDIKKRNPSATYRLQEIYKEIAMKESEGENITNAKKALEQRIRRTIQKSLQTIAELGCDDYSNSVFIEYSTILFDFKQVRQEMKRIEDPSQLSGKINVKKFLEGIISIIKSS